MNGEDINNNYISKIILFIYNQKLKLILSIKFYDTNKLIN